MSGNLNIMKKKNISTESFRASFSPQDGNCNIKAATAYTAPLNLPRPSHRDRLASQIATKLATLGCGQQYTYGAKEMVDS